MLCFIIFNHYVSPNCAAIQTDFLSFSSIINKINNKRTCSHLHDEVWSMVCWHTLGNRYRSHNVLKHRHCSTAGNESFTCGFSTQNSLVCWWWKVKSTPALKVPYYTVFHEFHTAVRGPTTLYSICIAPNTSVVLNSSCLKVALLSSIQSTRFVCLHL